MSAIFGSGGMPLINVFGQPQGSGMFYGGLPGGQQRYWDMYDPSNYNSWTGVDGVNYSTPRNLYIVGQPQAPAAPVQAAPQPVQQPTNISPATPVVDPGEAQATKGSQEQYQAPVTPAQVNELDVSLAPYFLQREAALRQSGLGNYNWAQDYQMWGMNPFGGNAI